MNHKIDIYNDFATEYANEVTTREEKGIERDPTIPRMLKIIGDVTGLGVLDAGCGEGYLSRILAERGATVTGIDISARLIPLLCVTILQTTSTQRLRFGIKDWQREASRFMLISVH